MPSPQQPTSYEFLNVVPPECWDNVQELALTERFMGRVTIELLPTDTIDEAMEAARLIDARRNPQDDPDYQPWATLEGMPSMKKPPRSEEERDAAVKRIAYWLISSPDVEVPIRITSKRYEDGDALWRDAVGIYNERLFAPDRAQ